MTVCRGSFWGISR